MLRRCDCACGVCSARRERIGFESRKILLARTGPVDGGALTRAMLTHTAEGFDFATGNVLKDEIEFRQGGIAFDGIERRRRGLRQHQRLTHCLLAGCKISE